MYKRLMTKLTYKERNSPAKIIIIRYSVEQRGRGNLKLRWIYKVEEDSRKVSIRK